MFDLEAENVTQREPMGAGKKEGGGSERCSKNKKERRGIGRAAAGAIPYEEVIRIVQRPG